MSFRSVVEAVDRTIQSAFDCITSIICRKRRRVSRVHVRHVQAPYRKSRGSAATLAVGIHFEWKWDTACLESRVQGCIIHNRFTLIPVPSVHHRQHRLSERYMYCTVDAQILLPTASSSPVISIIRY